MFSHGFEVWTAWVVSCARGSLALLNLQRTRDSHSAIHDRYDLSLTLRGKSPGSHSLSLSDDDALILTLRRTRRLPRIGSLAVFSWTTGFLARTPRA